jgi:pimeloyl-ACP methyl ester carboxylesterase
MPHVLLEDGKKLWYVEKGKGPTVVFVHDWLCSSNVFGKLVDHFSQWYRAIAFDLPGHGRSDKPRSSSYAISELAENLDQAMNKLIGNEKFVLVGHSLGGSIGLAYATTPALATKLKGLVLLNATPKPKSLVLDEYARKLQSGELNLKDRKLVEKMIAPYYFDAKFIKEHKDVVKEFVDSAAVDEEVGLKTLNSFINFDIEGKLGSLNVHTLVLAGDKDAIIPPESSKHLHKKIKKSDLRIVAPDIGHMTQLEADEQFKKELGAFLLTTK